MSSITISNIDPYVFEGIPTSQGFSLQDKPDWYLRIVAGYPIIDGLCKVPSRDELIKQINDFGIPKNNKFADMDIVQIYSIAEKMEIEQLFTCAIFDERFYYFFQDMGLEKLTERFMIYTICKFYNFFRYTAGVRGLKLVMGNKSDNLSLEKRKLTVKIDDENLDSVICTSKLGVHKKCIYGIPKSFNIHSENLVKYISKKVDMTLSTFYCVMKKKHEKVDKVPLVQIDISGKDLESDEIFEIDI